MTLTRALWLLVRDLLARTQAAGEQGDDETAACLTARRQHVLAMWNLSRHGERAAARQSRQRLPEERPASDWY